MVLKILCFLKIFLFTIFNFAYSFDMIFVENIPNFHYEILQEGNGKTLQNYHCPLINIKILSQENTLLHNKKMIFPLEDFPTLSKALIGMKKKEIRRIYADTKTIEIEILNLDQAALNFPKIEIAKIQ